MNNKNARILICILIVVLLTGCTAKDGNPAEFDQAIKNMSAISTCHTSEELVMIYPDQQIVTSIDRMYNGGDFLYTWAQQDAPPSKIVECGGTRYECVYYLDSWEAVSPDTAHDPEHLGFSPEDFTVDTVQETETASL